MTAQLLQFVEFSDEDREVAGRLKRGDTIELQIRRKGGLAEPLSLPPDAAALFQSLLGHLVEGERVAILTEERELSPADAAAILGISRPLVVHRMDIGALPFRYVGKHRRTKLKDVLALKVRIDAQRQALTALAEDADDLAQRYGI